jgi:predicted nucleic acid-binding Zn ribbon protein
MIRSNTLMRPLTHALPGALAALLRDAPLSVGKVNFAWRAAVGAGVERVTSVRLENGVLVVEAATTQWAQEVTRSSALILSRLKILLGNGTVTRIVVREP